MLTTMQILCKTGVITPGSHAVMFDEHDSADINMEAIFAHPQEVSRLCRNIADHFDTNEVATVVAPMGANCILAHSVAHHLFTLTGKKVFNVSADKVTTPITNHQGKEYFDFSVRDGDERFITGKRVLIVMDSINTDASAKKMIKAVRDACGTVIGVGALCSRVNIAAADIDAVPKFIALITLIKESLSSNECLRVGPCSRGVPANLRCNGAYSSLR